MYLLHYAEIGIKGGNRDVFERRLVLNLRETFKDLGKVDVRRRTGFLVLDERGVDRIEVEKRLGAVAGLASFQPCERLPAEPEAILKRGTEVLKDAAGTFRATVRRSDKRFPIPSQEFSARLGEAVLKGNPGLKVDLHAPEHVVRLEITHDGAFLSTAKKKGIGGLPVGTGGKLVSLLSGGIDSPVASWMMLKRGAILHYVHFHNFPYTDRASIDIAGDLARVLNRTGLRARLSLINLTPVQQEIAAACNPEYRVVLYRRMMFRIAERIALREGADGLVTGESLGQVASQTVQNMRAIEAVTALPVLRPLVGMDKEEIMDRARLIGTYETSIRPHADCCSLFMPPRPVTKANQALIADDEKKIDFEALIEQVLKEEERIDIGAAAW